MDDSQKYRYWMSEIKRSEKAQPRKKWKAAEDRLQVKTSDLTGESRRGGTAPYVNGYRLQYEGLKSFLDQRDAVLKSIPTKPFISNEVAIKMAECDTAYLQYIWAEKKCQRAESQKLDSTLQRNFGATLVYFDKRKWMPAVRYLPARDVLLDSNSEGVDERENWRGYKEDIPVEDFRKDNPDLSKEELLDILKHKGASIDEDEYEKIKEKHPDDALMYSTITVYHVFARGAYAIRKLEEGETNEVEIPEKSVTEDMEMEMPKKYLRFVKGLKKPLHESDWPFELDDEEFPITILKFNTPVESQYGFTDYGQMKRMDIFCDAIMKDIEDASYRQGNMKYTSMKNSGLTTSQINNFLNDPKESFIDGLMGPDGTLKINQVPQGEMPDGLIKAYDAAQTARKEASALGELLSQEVREYKDVTALAARLHDANVHQKINRRLNGPEGYEQTILEDAIKLMEIAHQYVPQLSQLEVPEPETMMNEKGIPVETGKIVRNYVDVPWIQALKLLQNPEVKLIRLGVDAIVGKELAQYWRTTEQQPSKAFKLSTKVTIVPGSTRRITAEQRAAVLKQYFLEVYMPIYQAMGAWDKAINYIKLMQKHIGLGDNEQILPSETDVMRFMQQVQQAQQEETKEK